MSRPALLVPLLAILSLAACGGGGGGGGGDFEDQLVTGAPGTGFTPGTGGGTGGTGGGGGTEPFTWAVLAAKSGSQVPAAETRIIRTQAEYDAFLGVVTNSEWTGGAPDIDFDQWMLVAVFIGQRPTARWSVTITNITPVGDGIHVDWVETDTRAPGCPPDLQVPSNPWVIATCTPRTGTATFAGSVQMRTCQ